MPFGRPLPVMIDCIPHNMSGAVTHASLCVPKKFSFRIPQILFYTTPLPHLCARP
jgi:hypothetical protein